MRSRLLVASRPCSCRYFLPSLRKREICWFISRITWYKRKNCSPGDAIDFAIDDCLMEGIFYSLFMHRRVEIKERLLQSFSSHLADNHLESLKKTFMV